MGQNVVAFPEPARRPRRWLRWTMAAFALVALVAGALVLYFSPVLAVDRVEVDGTRLVDRADVEERLRPLHGVPLPQVGRGRVQDLAGDLPGVESLDMIAAPPTGLQVTVHERRPVAAHVSDGTARVLMDDGAVLSGVDPRVFEGQTPVPVAPGVLHADERTRAAVAAVVDALPSALRERVEEVRAAGPDSVELRLEDGPSVQWGGTDQPRVKAAVVESLLGQGEESRAGVEELDVSVPDRPVTR
ncbi:cell division protein FtsQ/DivIB [Micrococcus lylae]|uniref:Cell division protein DivIVA n=1 Tax=Micrococcus lylae TaxID=1273 RepID=A0ABY2K162_9MICC|nr:MULTISPECIES: cell division protein FtsQ/DivIB [Micrococcus]MCT2007820.1 cell division protein FtsQ/DivIB [Micrococcus lylae]MCT2072020.1 cell division protein FtsQ/DivIB [Micrococcus lylae]TFI00186.1 cell division protein DivIVA [Micrococcus lylae]